MLFLSNFELKFSYNELVKLILIICKYDFFFHVRIILPNDLQISLSFFKRWKIVFKRCIQGSHCECYERISKNDTDSLVSVYSSGNGRAGAVDSRRIYRDQKNRPPDQENCIFCKSVILEYINNQNWKFLQKICTYYKVQNLYYIQCSKQLGSFFKMCDT